MQRIPPQFYLEGKGVLWWFKWEASPTGHISEPLVRGCRDRPGEVMEPLGGAALLEENYVTVGGL